MSSRASARRLVATAGAATLVATVGLTAWMGSASADACPAWTDPKGDSTTGQEGIPFTEDAQMDILSAAFGTVGDSVVGKITTDGLSNSSSDAGDEFGLRFTVAGQDVLLFVDRTKPGGQTVDVRAGFYNFTTDATGAATAVVDVKTKTVTLTGKLAELTKAAGKPVTGQAISNLRALTSNQVGLGSFTTPYDDAPTKLTTTIGTPCEMGGAAPAPAPATTGSATAAPSSSASPSASPSSTASATPSPTGSASASPSGSPTGAPAPGAALLPREGCLTFTDVKGDAKPLNANNPNNDPALDLTGLVLQTTPTDLVGWIKVDKLALGPTQSTDGARFSFRFTHNKNVFTAAGSTYKTAAASNVRGTLSQTGQVGANVQLSVNTPPLTDPNGRTSTGFVASGLKVAFDLKNSYVVMTVPRADIEKHGKAPLAGATLSAVDAISATETGALSSQVDQVIAPKPEEAVYEFGQNACFATPTALTSIGAVSAQFGDVARVAVRLTAAGAPAAGKQVTISLPGTSATVTTGADGVARINAVMRQAAGAGTMTATFAAADGLDSSTLSVPFTTTVEKTLLTATGSRGAVTATLRDDDRQPVAGQVLTFTQGSVKKTARTDAKGVAKAGGFTPGQVVKVTYTGAAGKYAATSLNARS